MLFAEITSAMLHSYVMLHLYEWGIMCRAGRAGHHQLAESIRAEAEGRVVESALPPPLWAALGVCAAASLCGPSAPWAAVLKLQCYCSETAPTRRDEATSFEEARLGLAHAEPGD